MKEKFEQLNNTTEKEKGKDFSFHVDSEGLGKNFEAHFSLSNEFLKNIESQIKTAYEAKIWKITLLDYGSDNNLDAGYATISIHPDSKEKFPLEAVVTMQGHGPREWDENGNEITETEWYSYKVLINENFEVIPHPSEQLKEENKSLED